MINLKEINFKELRTNSGWTLRQVQEITGISNSYLSQLETGKIENPSYNTVRDLLRLYEFSNDIQSTILNSEEQIIKEVLLNARKVQDFIWQEFNIANALQFNPFDWKVIFQKRVDCISRILPNHMSYKFELRKRVLQQAALSIIALKIIDKMS